MGDLVGLPGVAGGRIKDVQWASSVSGAMRVLLTERAVTGAGDHGAWTVWKDDAGLYRADFSRHHITLSEKTFVTKAGVKDWLREWLPKAAAGVMVDAAPQPTPYGLAGIDGDAIVIRLTADACAFAFANDPQALEPRPPVINKQQFLRDTLNELTAEREDGSTPLTDMLDRAMVKAMENGSDALDHDAAGVATDQPTKELT